MFLDFIDLSGYLTGKLGKETFAIKYRVGVSWDLDQQTQASSSLIANGSNVI